jgi:hypothetical protein
MLAKIDGLDGGFQSTQSVVSKYLISISGSGYQSHLPWREDSCEHGNTSLRCRLGYRHPRPEVTASEYSIGTQQVLDRG